MSGCLAWAQHHLTFPIAPNLLAVSLADLVTDLLSQPVDVSDWLPAWVRVGARGCHWMWDAVSRAAEQSLPPVSPWCSYFISTEIHPPDRPCSLLAATEVPTRATPCMLQKEIAEDQPVYAHAGIVSAATAVLVDMEEKGLLKVGTQSVPGFRAKLAEPSVCSRSPFCLEWQP